jgi:signal transduction histidine kinase
LFFGDDTLKSELTILYIEDDQTSARLMERLLVTKGYRFLHAENGLAGIKLASEEHPDLILMDINLPDIDGLAITTRLRHIAGLEHRPIVAVTAEAQASGRQMALASGCNGYIAKPIDVNELPLQIHRFLDGHEEKLSQSEENTYLKAHTAGLVTKLENRVKELAEANERLKEIDRQRAHFFNIVSHELRTPFTPIRGYIDLLRAGAMGPLTQPQRNAIEVISENLKNALRLLDDLLDFSKLKAAGIPLSPEIFSAKELFDDVVKSAQAYVENSPVAFETDIAKDLPLIYGDKGRLRQVILNLLNNAVKFTNAGSITLIGRIDHQNLVVRVKDTGIGLLPEEVDQVFSEFWQSKDIHGTGIGTGLGLSISKHLVQAHNGDIWLESEKGVGTTISFSIPVAGATRPEDKAESNGKSDTAVGNLTTLQKISEEQRLHLDLTSNTGGM